jgi:uncharacterized membrane protein
MVIDWGTMAPAIHVVAIVIWIGSVWLVTTVLLPRMKQKPSQEWIGEFDAIEHRFAAQARIAVLLVLLSGLYMLYQYDLWDGFMDRRASLRGWLHATSQSETDQLGQAARSHLVHDPRTVDLDRARADP